MKYTHRYTHTVKLELGAFPARGLRDQSSCVLVWGLIIPLSRSLCSYQLTCLNEPNSRTVYSSRI